MKDITIHDNLFSNEQIDKFRNFLLYNCQFDYGERDNLNSPPCGLVCDFTERDESLHPNFDIILKSLLSKIFEQHEQLKKSKIQSVYLNLFLPRETPQFHTDGEDTITCLCYLNPRLNYNEGGETQFIIDDEIKGVISKPGRLVVFNGKLLHRATSFLTQPRLTLAFKFQR